MHVNKMSCYRSSSIQTSQICMHLPYIHIHLRMHTHMSMKRRCQSLAQHIAHELVLCHTHTHTHIYKRVHDAKVAVTCTRYRTRTCAVSYTTNSSKSNELCSSPPRRVGGPTTACTSFSPATAIRSDGKCASLPLCMC